MKKEPACRKCDARKHNVCDGCIRPGTIKPRWRRGKPPKDGSWIVGTWNVFPECRRWRKKAEGGVWWFVASEDCVTGDPTKWMPLP